MINTNPTWDNTTPVDAETQPIQKTTDVITKPIPQKSSPVPKWEETKPIENQLAPKWEETTPIATDQPLEENWLKLLPAQLGRETVNELKGIVTSALPFGIGEKLVGTPEPGASGTAGQIVGTLGSFFVPGMAATKIAKIPALVKTIGKIATLPKYGKYLATATKHLLTTGTTFGLQSQIQMPLLSSIEERAETLVESEKEAALFAGIGVAGAVGGKIGKALAWPAMFGMGYKMAGEDADPAEKFVNGAVMVFLHGFSQGKSREAAKRDTIEAVKEQYKVDDVTAAKMVEPIARSPINDKAADLMGAGRITPEQQLAAASRGDIPFDKTTQPTLPPSSQPQTKAAIAAEAPVSGAPETTGIPIKTRGVAGASLEKTAAQIASELVQAKPAKGVGAAPAGGDEFTPPMTIKKPRIGFGGGFITEPVETITGLRETAIERQRKQYGLGPAMEKIKVSDPQANKEARQMQELNPNAGQDLIDSLAASDIPRPASKPEFALMLRHLVDVKLAHDNAATETNAAQKSGDPIRIRDANILYEKAVEKHQLVADTIAKTKTSNAQALQVLKTFMDEDYNIATMERHQLAATGQKTLTPEQRGEIKRFHDEYQKKSKIHKEDIAPQEAELKKEQDVADKTDEDVVMKDLEKKAVAKTTNESKEGKKPDFEGDKKKAIKKIQDAVESGEQPKISDLQDPIQKLALYFEQKDIDLHGKSTLGFREITKGVHSIVKRIIPKATYEETRDAISGYGEVRYPSEDAAKTALRRHKSEILKVAPIETVQKNIAALKEEGKAAEKELSETKHTGYQRDQIESKARDLTKKLASAMKEQDRLMKEVGIETGDPAKRLKSALDAKKTRLTNQIEDINRAIADRKELVRNKGVPVDNAETRVLEVERDRRMAEYKEIFPDKPMTDQERLDRAIKTTERSLAEWNERVANAEKGIFPTKEPGKPLPESERLSTLNREREAAKEEIKRLRDLAFPPLTPEEAAVAAFIKRTIKATERLQVKIDTQDFSKPVRKEIVLNKKAFESLQALNKVKEEWKGVLEINRMKNRLWTQKVFDKATDPFNESRRILSAFDLSGTLRQGGFLNIGRPVTAAKMLQTQLKVWTSPHEAYKANAEIQARENAKNGYYAKAKLDFTVIEGGMLKGEEIFSTKATGLSKVVGKLPGIKASERAFVTGLNRLRADVFDSLIKTMAKTGAPTDKELLALGRFINIATGRGYMGTGRLAMATEFLSTVFWSPKLLISRFQLLAGVPFYHGTARTRLLIAREYVRFLMGQGIVAAIAILAGATIETDPRSTDFGKLKFGNTRVDPWGGLSQASVFLARTIKGQEKTGRGRIVNLRGDKKSFVKSEADIIQRFLRSKLSPLIGTMVDIDVGESVVGEPVTPASLATRLTVPLSMNDILDSMLEQGVPRGTAMSLLSILGFGIQTYDNNRRDNQSAIDKLMWKIKFLNRQKASKTSPPK